MTVSNDASSKIEMTLNWFIAQRQDAIVERVKQTIESVSPENGWIFDDVAALDSGRKLSVLEKVDPKIQPLVMKIFPEGCPRTDQLLSENEVNGGKETSASFIGLLTACYVAEEIRQFEAKLSSLREFSEVSRGVLSLSAIQLEQTIWNHAASAVPSEVSEGQIDR